MDSETSIITNLSANNSTLSRAVTSSSLSIVLPETISVDHTSLYLQQIAPYRPLQAVQPPAQFIPGSRSMSTSFDAFATPSTVGFFLVIYLFLIHIVLICYSRYRLISRMRRV
ncbi:Movement protein [Caenorhabditis elegans]|uniref:Movement protein n=1 Tax=Caenorhabditis elegans TaxID=6239 RepID=O18047_CAEEL|nr:Movement protein [Caenorhabditis elegans]CAB03308.1 Movement protein [Caenorhabditis elegans]|eukprot:NP_506972.1 Uncharacterized protein CELE_T06C12.12 [Caenorhabditis elegans]